MSSKNLQPFLAALLSLYASVAGAEGLNNHDIKALFGRLDAAIHDPEATRKLTESSYDSAYLRNSEATAMFDNQPPLISPVVKNKAQLLLEAVNGLSMMNIASYERTISDIKFTDDKNWAYVYNKVTSSGTIGSGSQTQLRFSNISSCVDTVAVRDGALKLVRSDCKEIVKLNKP